MWHGAFRSRCAGSLLSVWHTGRIWEEIVSIVRKANTHEVACKGLCEVFFVGRPEPESAGGVRDMEFDIGSLNDAQISEVCDGPGECRDSVLRDSQEGQRREVSSYEVRVELARFDGCVACGVLVSGERGPLLYACDKDLADLVVVEVARLGNDDCISDFRFNVSLSRILNRPVYRVDGYADEEVTLFERRDCGLFPPPRVRQQSCPRQRVQRPQQCRRCELRDDVVAQSQ